MNRIIAGLLILVVMGSSCAKPKDLEFIDIQDIRMAKWGLKESIVEAKVRFFNPNNKRVQIKDANVKVYVNSTYLGDTYTDSTVSVPRRDTFSVPVFLKVQTATAITQGLQTLSDSAVNIRVEGSVKMGKAGMFMTYPIRYERLQKMSDIKL